MLGQPSRIRIIERLHLQGEMTVQRRFHVIGIGVERGTSAAGSGDGMTYTTDVGS